VTVKCELAPMCTSPHFAAKEVLRSHNQEMLASLALKLNKIFYQKKIDNILPNYYEILIHS
jgi:hypothetical protein